MQTGHREKEGGEPTITRRRVLGGAAGVAAAGVAGCVGTPGSDSGTATDGTGTVSVTLESFSISLSRTTLPSGSVTFDIANQADIVHEFVVFSTELAADELPTTNGGAKVDEEASSLTRVGGVEDIEAGANEGLTVDLDPGHYVGICNISGHYQNGMRVGITVE